MQSKFARQQIRMATHSVILEVANHGSPTPFMLVPATLGLGGDTSWYFKADEHNLIAALAEETGIRADKIGEMYPDQDGPLKIACPNYQGCFVYATVDEVTKQGRLFSFGRPEQDDDDGVTEIEVREVLVAHGLRRSGFFD